MSFPNPALPAPPLVDYQLSFKGLVFGGVVEGTPYQLVKLKGLTPPDVVGGDVQRALDTGELIGLDLLPGKDIELETVIQADVTSLDHARQVLSGALTGGGVIESPLYLQLPSGAFAMMARPKKHAPVGSDIDVNALIAGGNTYLSMLHATDPRWYAVPTKSQTVGLGHKGLGGLTFPVKPPFVFTHGIEVATIIAHNNGMIEMRPVFIITGPCLNPSISNLSIPGAPTLAFNIELEAGDMLTIDTDFQTVSYRPAGAPFAVSRRDTVAPGSEWFNLPPGASTIVGSSTTATVGATLTCQSADAYAGI